MDVFGIVAPVARVRSNEEFENSRTDVEKGFGETAMLNLCTNAQQDLENMTNSLINAIDIITYLETSPLPSKSN
jgi:hypothetical protein